MFHGSSQYLLIDAPVVTMMDGFKQPIAEIDTFQQAISKLGLVLAPQGKTCVRSEHLTCIVDNDAILILTHIKATLQKSDPKPHIGVDVTMKAPKRKNKRLCIRQNNSYFWPPASEYQSVNRTSRREGL